MITVTSEKGQCHYTTDWWYWLGELRYLNLSENLRQSSPTLRGLTGERLHATYSVFIGYLQLPILAPFAS